MGRKTASGDEAAAIAAAIARFEAEFGAGAADEPAPTGRWQRAALIEGVSAKQSMQDIEGGSKWLS